MLVDLCDHRAQSRIKTDRVSFDGYEVQNLVSSNTEEKRKGFLSDHFIKPPVNVTVQFPCNVSIYRIVIDPVIGQQKSCDLKIFTASEKMTDSWLYNNVTDKKVHTDGIVFNYVGSVTQVDPTVVCFINNQFKERNLWRIENIPDVKTYPCIAQLNTRKPGDCLMLAMLLYVLIVVKVVNLLLKRLEIWGIPSVKVPYPVQNTLRNVFIAATRKTEDLQKTVPQDTGLSSKLIVDNSSNNANRILIDGVSVPDDFIDQITFEIMTVPVMLPCGRNVDQSTLERYVNTEASWGRPPSDPFTAVIFSPGSGPVTNTSLKARIDQFVLKHSLNVPQTLGYSDVHKAKKHTIVSSKLVSSQPIFESMCKYSVPKLSECTTSQNITHRSELDQEIRVSKDQTRFPNEIETGVSPDTSLPGSLKRRHSDRKLLQSRSKDKLSAGEDRLCIDLTSDVEMTKITPTKKQKVKSTDHNSNLSRSLDSALLSALGSLPSFTKKSSQRSSVDTSDRVLSCSKCRSDLTKSDVIKYKTTCGHFICRSCLVLEATCFSCNICYSQCQSSQTVRMF
ncbi:LOW QUALITY PROTEIN: RING finger protein 37-like [Mercenaria mercenaria]|uniref:LOW QUALITY PROTEIN: RING finger protein 37-like n=1 Tax=Mercenaria mercenaria TaxID=6596 RepID=UPI00234F2178|nr:LOW QUALITY PROTEIN: RING finger protein 37-like [Mercenaria mercenaria]